MNNSSSITIKGRSVRGKYETSLPDLFYKECNEALHRSDTNAMLRSYGDFLPGLSCDILDEVFPPSVISEQRDYTRYPCVMKDAPDHKVRLNLMYQDTRIKLGVEDRLAKGDSPVTQEFAVQSLLKIYLLLLRTSLSKIGPVWQHCTDNDLDALSFMILDAFDPQRKEVLLRDGHTANRNSLEVLESLFSERELPLDRFLKFQIHAGTVWWSERPPHRICESELVVNDYDLFASEALYKSCRLVFLFDDNGELVWDLMMIQKLLQCNAELVVVGVVSTRIVANNANKSTFEEIINHELFRGIRTSKNFHVFYENNLRSSIDMSFCSKDLLNIIKGSDLIFIKGVSFFETIQNLEITSYYGFVVHSLDSQNCTGFEKGDGIFVRIPMCKSGFDYGKTCLRDLYDGLSSGVLE